jgi:hypothetical protein
MASTPVRLTHPPSQRFGQQCSARLAVLIRPCARFVRYFGTSVLRLVCSHGTTPLPVLPAAATSPQALPPLHLPPKQSILFIRCLQPSKAQSRDWCSGTVLSGRTLHACLPMLSMDDRLNSGIHLYMYVRSWTRQSVQATSEIAPAAAARRLAVAVRPAGCRRLDAAAAAGPGSSLHGRTAAGVYEHCHREPHKSQCIGIRNARFLCGCSDASVEGKLTIEAQVRPGYGTSVHVQVTFHGLGAPAACANMRACFTCQNH